MFVKILYIVCQIIQIIGIGNGETLSSDVAALYDFFNSTKGERWTWKYPLSQYGNEWNFTETNVDPCASNWQGLQCANLTLKSGSLNTTTVISISLIDYNVDGKIPLSLYNISGLSIINLSNNFLSGAISSDLCKCKNLTMLSLQYNLITGVLPSCLLNDLPLLQFLDFESNILNGEIPEINDIQSAMIYLSLSINFMDGIIPSSISRFPNMQQLFLFGCFFSSSLPESLGELKNLQILALNTNLFTGQLPSSIFSISPMRYLYLHQNHFASALPTNFSALPNLVYLSLYENMMYGPIPPSIGDASNLKIMFLDDNCFTGSLPNELGNLKYLQQLAVYDCFFTGTIPSSIASLANLQLLLLNENFFTGNPSASFDSSLQISLNQVDFSNNAFTGQLPSEVFGLQLHTLASVDTCFTQSLPSTICKSVNLQSLVIDGIGSGSQCRTLIWPLIPKSPTKVRAIPGGIPSCLWTEMRNLSVLYMSNNGLTGRIPTLESYGNLSSLDLSFNSLTGSIPENLQSWKKLSILNLQNNKLTGYINSIGALNYAYNPSEPGVSLTLTVNRLSGVIPWPLQQAYNINICDGNMFSCSFAHQPPVHNPGSNEYVCGSNLLNYSLYTFGVSFAVVAIATIVSLLSALAFLQSNNTGFSYWMRLKWFTAMLSSEYCLQQAIDQIKLDSSNIRFVRLRVLALSVVLWKYKIDGLLNAAFAKKRSLFALSFSMGKEEMSSIQNVTNFLQTSRILRNIAILLLAMIMFLTLPIYSVLKHFFGTYTEQYQWTISGLFLSGYQPAVALILLWISLLTVAVTMIKIYVPHKVQDDNDTDESAFHSTEESKETHDESIPKEATDVTCERSESDNDKSINRPKVASYANIKYLWRKVLAFFSECFSYIKKLTVWISITTVAFNIAVVLTIKVVMIYLLLGAEVTFTEKLFIETALSFIDLFWGIILVPAFINKIHKKSALGKLILKVSLLYFNSLVAPFVIIGVSDDSCYSGLFLESPQKEANFVFPFCLIYALNGTETTTTNQCVVYSSWTSIKYFNSSFYYNYTCYSTILKEYIPIFLLSSTLSILLIPVGTFYLISRTKRGWYFDLLPHIYWIEGANSFLSSPSSSASHSNVSSDMFLSSTFPSKESISFVNNPVNSPGIASRRSGRSISSHSSVGNSESSTLQARQFGESRESSPVVNLALTDPKNLFYPYVIIASMLHDILLLMTFGIMCPWLAAAVVVNLCVTHFFWEILLARYICSICPSFAMVVPPFDLESVTHLSSDSSISTPFSNNSTDSSTVLSTSHKKLSITMDFTASSPRDTMAMRQRYTSVCSNEAIQSVDMLCRNVWHGPKKCLWLIVYGSALFFALVTLDMAGDQQGWLLAMWAPCSILFLALSILYLVRVISLWAKNRQEAALPSNESLCSNSSSNRKVSGSGRKLSAVELTTSNIMFDKTTFTSQNVVIREKRED